MELTEDESIKKDSTLCKYCYRTCLLQYEYEKICVSSEYNVKKTKT